MLILPTKFLVQATEDQVIVRPFKTSHVPSPTAPELTYPLIIRPEAKLEYFEPVQALSIKGLLFGNPMILMLVYCALIWRLGLTPLQNGIGSRASCLTREKVKADNPIRMMIGMPKLLAAIDPEALKEVQESQAQMHSKG